MSKALTGPPTPLRRGIALPNQKQEAAAVRRLYWTSYVIRYSFGLSAWIATVFFGLGIMEDALNYSGRAADTAQAWLSGEKAVWLEEAIAGERQAWLMVYVLAIFYLISAGAEIVPLALGLYCLLTTWSTVLAYRVARQLGVSHQGAIVTGSLIAFSPAFAIWGSALYKEGLVLIAMYLVMLHGLRLQEAMRPMSVVVLGLSFMALFGLRFYMATILMGGLAIGLLMGRSSPKTGSDMPPIFRQLILLALVSVIFGLVGISGKANQMASADLSDNLAKINSSRRDLASYRSGYLEDADVSTPEKALAFLPIGMAYFLTVPLPWHLSTMRQNIAIPESFFWLVVIYPCTVRGIGRAWLKNKQGTIFLLVAAFMVTAFYGIFCGNIGTAYRMRIQVWAIFAIFAGWGWSRIDPGLIRLPIRKSKIAAVPGGK
ncbi:hypothetical protein BH10PLA2_BH10PLA2_16010 [soil metagenome]